MHPAGGRGTEDAQGVLPPDTHVFCPRRGAGGGWRLSNGLPPLFAAANLVRRGAVPSLPFGPALRQNRTQMYRMWRDSALGRLVHSAGKNYRKHHSVRLQLLGFLDDAFDMLLNFQKNFP